MLRKPYFWIAFVIVAAICVVLALRGFPLAFPLVTLDLQMDREAALASAEELAEEHGWGPADYRQAAVFRVDGQVQSFVELEAGGNPAFAEMLEGDLYSPFTWVVRNFKGGETNETLVRFTPAGRPYGFREKIPEDQPGASLDGESARSLAEETATQSWSIDLDPYDLAEASQEVRPSGRTDHTLVYERNDAKIGDGRYRLRLVVSGDRFTELTHFVKVPEAFERRYEEMRSLNNSISFGASIAMLLLYLAGGCVVGLFFLLRKRWVLWRQAVIWAAVIAVLQGLVSLNQWPLTWMGYDTAVSPASFVLQQLALTLVQTIGLALLLALSFIAAESLTRRAFPKHIQFWKLWSPEVAGTPAVLGRTAAGYLLVSLFFAYEVALYFLAHKNLGWWTPSGALSDPNILATYFPWLSSVARSLQAGFWEECLFRAVPLACAALLGRRFGGRTYWIVAALILQAVVFGAGHANYPAQPAYARLLELIIPALCFGGIYLAWGLLPAIVLHFAFDVVWMAMPLFASSAPGVWFDQSMVIILTMIPLLVIAYARWRHKQWGELPEAALNSAWSPPAVAPAEPRPEPVQVAPGLSQRFRIGLIAAGVAGALVWLLASSFRSDAPRLPINRDQALASARQELAARGIDIKEPWRELSAVRVRLDMAHRFIWQEGGSETYQSLLGRYLDPPRWMVRYARFTGDVAERAEEYRILVGSDGTVVRFTHQLPEARPGPALEEDAARDLAHTTVAAAYGLDPVQLKEISAEPDKLPERRDWKLIFASPDDLSLAQGEARIAVHIAGDQVSDCYRFVHVPEEWERQERDRQTRAQIVRILSTVAIVLLFVAGAVVAVIRWSRKRFAAGTFVSVLVIMLVLGAIEIIIHWPQMTAQLSTAQSFPLQAGIFIGGGLMIMLIIAAVSALIVGMTHRWLPPQPAMGAGAIAAGIALGALAAGLAALAATVSTQSPSWPELGPASAQLPWLAAGLGPIVGLITTTAMLLLVVALIHAATRGWSCRQVPFSILLVLLGLVLVGSEGAETIPLWLASGLGAGMVLWVAYVTVLRFNMALLPLALATATILATVRQGILNAYPGAITGSVIAVLLIGALAMVWAKRMVQDTALPNEPGG
jgi:membrane protease YdiL (CAAX protease family)